MSIEVKLKRNPKDLSPDQVEIHDLVVEACARKLRELLQQLEVQGYHMTDATVEMDTRTLFNRRNGGD